MDEQYTRALTWEAATERLEAAGSIPVKEAELMKEALSSEEAGVEASFEFVYPRLSVSKEQFLTLLHPLFRFHCLR